MKLISMTDFVLEQMKEVTLDGTGVVCARIGNYANFLKQPLTLAMFVPCDLEGNVLEEPHNLGLINTYPTGDVIMDKSFEKAIEYQQAKERVLFEGCFLNFKGEVIVKETEFQTLKYADSNWTIEDLTQFDLTLTQSAIKQIGL